jgi:hypothetical protein
MNFLSRLFRNDSRQALPNIPFGRFSDAYKSDEQQQAFDRSLEAFEQGDLLTAYREFMLYLLDEEAQRPNVTWEEKDGGIQFEFYQGSQRISGFAGKDGIKAESRVAKAMDLNVGVMRRLMEANFHLKFSRFALDAENNLCIVFDTKTLDGSPLKVLHALRELAIHADKQDDLLLGEFSQALIPAEERQLDPVPEHEKEVKYQYIHRSIEAVMAEMDKGKPDPNVYPGTYAYLFLALAFKLDYLIKPEGFMMDLLERVYAAYFTKSNLTPQLKLQQMRKEFQIVLERPKEAIFAEMYRTQSTFGANPAVPHGTVASFIDGELPNMEWPLQQGHDQLALAIPQYIAGFILFHQAPPKPDRAFLHLFFQITESSFFRELGYPSEYVDQEGRLQKTAIFKEIKLITEQYRAEYTKLRPDTTLLNFGSLSLFARSYLQMVKGLDVAKD